MLREVLPEQQHYVYTNEYPETAKYIQQAVDKHGEDRVVENHYQRLCLLGTIIEMPEKEELPFYDPDTHDTMTEAERVGMYQAWAAYRENLRTGTKPNE